MVKGPSCRSTIGRGTLPEVRKWSGDHPKGLEVAGDPREGPEVVGGSSQRSGSGRGNLLEDQKWSGDPLLGL